uniref:uncharacterized protein LOC132688015 n=1 Tax=Panthera onca TaxID=9690 RepID=UPI002952ABE7|nr:uncharacterized protein LOC132688015 [Panthera onca]
MVLRRLLAKASEPPVARREAAVTTANYYLGRPQAFGAGGQRAVSPQIPPAWATSRLRRGRALVPNPERGWLSLLPGRAPRRGEGTPAQARCSRRRAMEKLRRRTAPCGTRQSQGQRAGTTPVPEEQALWERRWDAEAPGSLDPPKNTFGNCAEEAAPSPRARGLALPTPAPGSPQRTRRGQRLLFRGPASEDAGHSHCLRSPSYEIPG